jgi:hypothetical protein
VATDPVGIGLVTSLGRPGGNVTGLSVQLADTAAKRLELLREAVAHVRRLAVMANVDSPGTGFSERRPAVLALRLRSTIRPSTFGRSSMLTQNRRIAAIGSGHLSLELGGPRQF